MEPETLEDHLRRTTRRAAARMDEERLLALARDLLRELAAAHAETPARHPSFDPADVRMEEGVPRLGAGGAGDASEDLFQLGALITSLATGTPPDVAWRLDPAPRPELSSVQRRALVAGLAAPRRTDRFASAADALAAAEAALGASASTAAPWPMFRGGPERAGARPAAGAARGLETAWHARVGPVLASPVVAGGVVVAAAADGRVLFLDPGTGRVLESVSVGAAIESSPAVAGDVVWLGTDDGRLVGIGLSDGAVRHRVALGPSMVRSSPLVRDDLVIAGTVDAKGQGALVARAADGTPRWTRKLAAVFSSPASAGALVIVGGDDGAAHAIEASSGAPRWSRAIGTKVRATPAVAGDVAYAVSLDGNAVALSVADGAMRWERALGHAVYSSACLAAGLVVFGCHEGHLHGLDAATGEARFETATRGAVLASPVALGARVLVASTDGHAYLLDEAGAVARRLALAGGATQSSFALDGGRAFVGGGEGVHALAVRA